MATYPTPPKSTSTRTTSSSKSTSSSRSSSGSSSRSSSSSSASSDPYARARADAKAAEAKAAARYASQADKLKAQAEALKIALGAKGFRATLSRELAASNLEYSEKDALILAQYGRGKTALEQQADTTENVRASTLQDAGQNAGRERNEALQQGIENGISATDMLKAQAASLRNWSFNVGQTQQSYTDEINGIQSEHSQMVNSVVTSRQQAFREREQQRSQLYRNYYDNYSQVNTEVGNKLGEASQYYDMANEQKASATYKKGAAATHAEAMKNLKAAATWTGSGYTEQATPKAITDWQGTADIRNRSDARMWGQQALEVKDAEGAKLRKWQA